MSSKELWVRNMPFLLVKLQQWQLLFVNTTCLTSADGALPESKVGAILAIADKLDTILSFFSVGLIPSGSNDPYALRRATQGVVRILDAFGWHIPMDELIDSLYASI